MNESVAEPIESQAPAPRRVVRLRQKSGPAAEMPSIARVEEVAARGAGMQPTFFLALTVGFALACLGLANRDVTNWIGLVGPIFTVAAFFVWGRHKRWQDFGDTKQRFADSCYFLGFLFTMWALLVGFVPAGLFGHELGSQEILRHFGMALGATAAGLICRILVLQSGDFGLEAARVEEDLRQYARRVAEETRDIATDLEDLRSELTRAQHETAEAMAARFEAVLENIASEFSSSVLTIRDSFGAALEGVEQRTKGFALKLHDGGAQVDRATERAVVATSQFAEATDALTGSLGSFEAGLSEAQARSRQAIEQAAAQVRAAADSFSVVGAHGVRIGETAEGLQASLDEVGAALDGLRTETRGIAGDRTRFETGLQDATAELTRVVESFTAQLAALRQTAR